MRVETGKPPLRAEAGEFLDYLEEWSARLAPVTLESLVAEAGGAQRIGLFCVDVINGFCHEGPLASRRVQAIIAPIERLFTAAYAVGIRHFVLTRDDHDPDAAEFAHYPPHCIRGTRESEIVPELKALPFASQFHVLPKNSIHSALGTGLDVWLDAHPHVSHRIVVGDCTDLCTYQLAMHLKLRTLAANEDHQVLLPADCVDTYDVPVRAAREMNIPAHPAELFHAVFLYSMAMNGVRVVSRIAA
jgi:nicotinamidase-related amidase